MEEIAALEANQLKPAKSINKDNESVQAADISRDETTNNVPAAAAAFAGIIHNDVPIGLAQYDVVQVYDPESNHYGIMFQVGDVRGTKVHGYYFMPRGEKVFVTFEMKQLRLIGIARVRSKGCCSPKWISEYHAPQQ